MPDAILNCDWGTTRLRLRLFDLDAQHLHSEFRSLDGVALLAEQHRPPERPLAYRTALLEGLLAMDRNEAEFLAGAPILISGMASSSLGWEELPYAQLPFALDGSGFVWRELDPIVSGSGSHRVMLLSGVRSAVDVLRGEESELLGLFTLPPFAPLADRSLVIKPGTHSKHVHVAAGGLVDFRTFMTGELFDVLGKHSVLRHSIASGSELNESAAPDIAIDDLRAGVREASQSPLPSALFRVRTRQILDGIDGQRERAFLSGVLIGSELAYLTGKQFTGYPLILCATQPLDLHYQVALEELGLTARLSVVPADDVELLSGRGQALWWQNQSREQAGPK